MKKTLILSAALVLTAAGCKTLSLRPDPTPPPNLPPIQYVPDTAPPMSLPSAQFIIVSTCEPTGTYVATGVDTRSGRFTFLIKGTAATRSAAFTRFYAAGVPVSVYTGPVKLTGGMAAPAQASEPPPPPNPPPPPPSGEEPPEGGDPIFRPCDQIGDDPEDPKIPTGYPPPDDSIWVFQNLAWQTANALDAVTDQISASTVPVPR